MGYGNYFSYPLFISKGVEKMEYTLLGFAITLVILLSADAVISLNKGVY